MNSQALTKKAILALTNGGYTIFAHYLKSSYKGARFDPSKAISNPFLSTRQKTPSFSFYQHKDGIWFFKDFANPNYSGDCFTLVHLSSGLDLRRDFPEILRRINVELGLGLIDQRDMHRDDQSIIQDFKLNHRDFNSGELKYWSEFGVDVETLKRHGVSALQSFQFQTKAAKTIVVHSTEQNPIFACLHGTAWKIYQPLATDGRFKWRYFGTYERNFVFAYDLLPENTETIIITGGIKDVLALNSRGFIAICLNSETATIGAEFVETLKKRAQRVAVCYDNDSTGAKCAVEMCESHELVNIALPSFSGKDVADYFKAGYSATDFQQLIEHSFAHFEATQILRSDKSRLPQFKAKVHEHLPNILRCPLSYIERSRERDAALLAALPLLSHGLPNVVTRNRDGLNYLSLYSVIVGDFSSGKGVLSPIKRIGNDVNKYIINESTRLYEEWKLDGLREDKDVPADSDKKRRKERTRSPAPYRSTFFLTGDTSVKALKQHMYHNNGRALIFETELDALTSTSKQLWGDFSDSFRKAFHGESLTHHRDQNTESESPVLLVENPVLNHVLSGTPKQLQAWLGLGGVENGTYSRYLLYFIHAEPSWISRRPGTEQVDFERALESASTQLTLLYKELLNVGSIEVVFSEAQFDYIDEVFGSLFRIWSASIPEIGALVPRSSLMAQRVASVLCVLRESEVRRLLPNSRIECSAADFMIGCEVARTCFMHSAWFALKNLVTQPSKSADRARAIEMAKNGFSIRAIASEVQTPSSTIGRWIKEYKDKRET